MVQGAGPASRVPFFSVTAVSPIPHLADPRLRSAQALFAETSGGRNPLRSLEALPSVGAGLRCILELPVPTATRMSTSQPPPSCPGPWQSELQPDLCGVVFPGAHGAPLLHATETPLFVKTVSRARTSRPGHSSVNDVHGESQGCHAQPRPRSRPQESSLPGTMRPGVQRGWRAHPKS